jgi:hypothetical protein
MSQTGLALLRVLAFRRTSFPEIGSYFQFLRSEGSIPWINSVAVLTMALWTWRKHMVVQSPTAMQGLTPCLPIDLPSGHRYCMESAACGFLDGAGMRRAGDA